MLKQGQKTQLKSGVALARSLQLYKLKPSTLSTVLWIQAAKDIHSVLAAAVRRSLKPLLVEWCCDQDSTISTEFENLGGEIWRLSLPDWDVSNPKVVKYVIDPTRTHSTRTADFYMDFTSLQLLEYKAVC